MQQRYLYSPEKQKKQLDLNKPAWERLLERSFDVNAIQKIKQTHQKLLANRPTVNGNDVRGRNPILNDQHTEKEKVKDTKELSLQQYQNSMSVWKCFLDKTSDCKVIKSDQNYCGKRNIEEFLSARTVNPMRYSS